MAKPKIPPDGELRQSQVITTFGPGAMVDLPDHAVLIGGLDHWHGDRARIYEERLESRVRELLGAEHMALYAPPVDKGRNDATKNYVHAFQFPLWFLGQVEKTYRSQHGRTYRTRPLVPAKRLPKRGQYQGEDRKYYPVVPVRFVRACVLGHLTDMDWYAFVHKDFQAQQVGSLWFDEGGAGNDFQDIFVRAAPSAEAHGPRRPLSDATVPDSLNLGRCPGHQPWLGPHVKAPCDKPARLLTRSASNAYFAQTLSVISIPDLDAPLKEAVDWVYDDFLQYCEEAADIARERRKAKVAAALEGYDNERVWVEVKRRREGDRRAPAKSIKKAEIDTLMSPPPGETGEYHAEARDLHHLPPGMRRFLNQVVLVHKMREVVAQIGFTRFEVSMPDIDGELSIGVEPAPLAMNMTWVPSNENRGEGIFLAFSADALADWQRRPAVQERAAELKRGFLAWKDRKGLEDVEFPGLPYLMLHSLSHLLTTEVALECGYAAGSIRERIYAIDEQFGILLYTAGSGSEGTLGGLVEVGRSIELHLMRALERGRLCSNDPVCAQHAPDNKLEERFLHGAACHGCLLMAETSCERRNELLDRALVVPTVKTPEAAFFDNVDELHQAVVDALAKMTRTPAQNRQGDRAWKLSELSEIEDATEPFVIELSAAQAPGGRGGRFQCVPLTVGPDELEAGSWVLIQHPQLTRRGQPVGAAAGQWQARKMRVAADGEPRWKIFLKGITPPAELDLSESEWADFRPLGQLTREER